jgi:hypothetical protein
MPFWRARAIAEDMKLYKANNVVGYTTEGNNTFFRTGLNYYVRARYMWDVNTNIDKLLDDFYTHFFGPASAPMKQFCEEIEAMLQATPDHTAWQPHFIDWTAMYPPARVAALGKLLDQAEAKADTPEIKGRIKLYRILHQYMTAYLNVYALEHQGKYTEALIELDKLSKLTGEAQAMQKGLLPPDPDWVLNEGRGLNYQRTYLTELANRTDGKLGELLAFAPQTAQFLEDPRNIGYYEQWQRDDVANALVPIYTRNVEHLAAAGADAGQVRHTSELRFLLDARDHVVGAFARGTVGAVGHRDETRTQRFEISDRLPQGLFHGLVGGRKELEGNGYRSLTGHGIPRVECRCRKAANLAQQAERVDAIP